MENEINIMDINDGEYIRTKNGTIAKVEDTVFDIKVNSFRQVLYEIYVGREHWYEVIVKHSPNIIDLIEANDYVNGCKVYENHKTYLIVHQKVKNSEVDYNYINHNEIKSIVTHQQFKSIEYKVKE